MPKLFQPTATSLMFCFFQIKATDQGYTKKKNKLKVQIDKKHLDKLSQYNAPSYLIGIDHDESEPFKSKAYIATIRGAHTKGLSSMKTIHELTPDNLILLRNEIENFWTGVNTIVNKLNYVTNFNI